MNELTRIQNHLVSKDTAYIWGKNHPNAK
jgi:hypothetical protein